MEKNYEQGAASIAYSIGIVVIGRNEGKRLTRCLQSLDLKKTTVVYVDSGSSDGSQENARTFGAYVVELDLSRPFTAARARNTGFSTLKRLQPKLHFVQFIDGDCSLAPAWLPLAQKFMSEHKDVAAVCGRRREINPQSSIYNWLCDVEWATPTGEASSCGGDAVFRVAPFENSLGYRDILVAGEEPELCVRLREKGWKIWRIPAEMTLHDAGISRFSQWWRRCERGGYGMLQVACLHYKSKYGIWKRESARAIIYGGIIPAVLVAGLFFPPLLLAFLIYPILITKIAASRDIRKVEAWQYAFMITVAKFAEFKGMISLLIDAIKKQQRTIIEYK